MMILMMRKFEEEMTMVVLQQAILSGKIVKKD